MHEWVLDYWTIGLLSVSMLSYIVFSITVAIVVDWRAGVFLVVVALLVLYAMWLLLVWVRHSFFLPRYGAFVAA